MPANETEPLLGNVTLRKTGLYGDPKLVETKVDMNGRVHGKSSLSWHNINVFLTQKRKGCLGCCGGSSGSMDPKQILKNVSGIVHSNQLLAILGASGAGKTTLLNVLNMRKSESLLVDGDVRLNGNSVSRDAFVQMSAFVQQEDLFIASLTVREQLIFQAMLRMDRAIPYAQRMKRVEEVILELGLTKCSDSVIGDPGSAKSISGGEMKRLAFGAEVLTNPPLMFCDEPTSGLDSFMAQNVVGVLKQMANKGKVVISTIHQPSSEVFSMFDRILLMAEGRVAFLGNREDAYDFFKTQGFECPTNYNPADFYILTLAVVPGQEEERKKRILAICDQFETSSDMQNIIESITGTRRSDSVEDEHLWDTKVKTRFRASWWSQFRAVLWRSTLTVIREPHLLKARFFQSIFVALLLGVIFYGQVINQEGVMNINGAIFLLLTNMTFQNIFGVIHVFCLELPVFYRENQNGMYRTSVYFWAKTMAEFPLFVVIAIIFTAISYWMTGFYPAMYNFIVACGIITLVAHTSCSFGYMMSTVSPSLTVALSLAAPLTAPLLFFGGFFLNAKSFPEWLVWMQYFSWFRYSNEALLINQWEQVDEIECNRPANQTCFSNGEQVLESYSFDKDNFTFNICFLTGQLLTYRIIAYIALLIRARNRS